ncbi:MAG: FAD-dependent oxidoreductase [Vicinamibacterales bacterium]|nr:FAD-dependent oxidoreductase [Vicinamibacterales bacterium]
MKIAVIGAGVSGLSAAYLLAQAHDVTLFEREPRLGGHAHTHAVQDGARTLPVDTGFMVFNERTYPNFIRLLARLGVASRPSDMSFSVRCRRCGLEFSSVGARGLFAQPWRVADPRHLVMLADVLRFFRRGRRALADGTAAGQSLGEFLARGRHTTALMRHFLLPMGGAIWSASSADMRAFPAESFLRFFDNHGLLAPAGQPVWRTVVGGSQAYVGAIARALDGRVQVAAPVRQVRRGATVVEVQLASGVRAMFDQVVMATHADEALALLADPSDAEREALGAFRYSTNRTVLHTDGALLPAARAARASWNCDLADCRDEASAVSVTYDLDRLQGHAATRPILASLNSVVPIGGEVLAEMAYTHPILDGAAFAAQPRVARLNGQRRTFYCGAHLRYGFHEDGVMSALAVTRAFGIDLDRVEPAAVARLRVTA